MFGYWALMDGADYPGGHGSHVSGSVAGQMSATGGKGGGNGLEGSSECGLAAAGAGRFDGMAPGAKLLFVDLQCNADQVG